MRTAKSDEPPEAPAAPTGTLTPGSRERRGTPHPQEACGRRQLDESGEGSVMGTTHHQGTAAPPSTPQRVDKESSGTRKPQTPLRGRIKKKRVCAFTSPNFDMRLLGELEDRGVVVVPLTGQEFDSIMDQYRGDGIYEVADA